MPVDQLLYGRVEPEYSARRFPGFQTICKSAGVTPAEVKAIEAAVTGFTPAPDAPAAPRLQFFRVGERVVLTHSVGFDTNEENYRKYIERDGRGGGFICHALVLSRSDFEEYNCQPFRLLDGFLARKGVNSLPKLIQFLTDNGEGADTCPTVELPEPRDTGLLKSRLSVSSDERTNLILLLQAVRQASHPGLVVEGGPTAVADLFRLMLSESARVAGGEQLWFLRQCLTFDTLTQKADQKGLFWAVGVPTRLRPDGRRVWVDAEADSVVIGSVAPPSSRYLAAWVDWAKANLDADALVGHLPDVLRLSAVYDEGKPLGTGVPPSREACLAFYKPFAADVTADAVGKAGAGLTKSLADGLGTLVRQAVAEGYAPWWRETPVNPATVTRWLAAWVRVQQPDLDAKELKQLRQLGEAAAEWPLVFWAICLTPPGWFGDGTKEAVGVVGTMTPEQFTVAVEWLGRPVPPAKYFHPDHAAALATAAVRAPLTSAELYEVMELLIKNDRIADLASLADRVDRLSAGELRKLSRLLGSAADVPDSFRFAVDKALTPVLPPYPELSVT